MDSTTSGNVGGLSGIPQPLGKYPKKGSTVKKGGIVSPKAKPLNHNVPPKRK